MCMPKPIKTRDLRIFGDESSHTGDRDYLTYGTLSCDGKKLDHVVAKLERASCDPSELKWNNLITRNRGRYLRFATAICDLFKGNGPLWYPVRGHPDSGQYLPGRSEIGDAGLRIL